MQIAESDLVDVSKFDQQQKAQVQQIAESVDLRNSTTAMTFGTQPQQKINKYLDSLMQDMRTEHAGVAGDLAIEMAHGIEMMQLQKVDREMKGWTLAKLPLIGKFFSALRIFYERKQKILDQFDSIIKKANDRKRLLVEYNTKLDTLMLETEQNIRELELWIAGGEMALKNAHDEFHRMKEAFDNDPVDAAKIHDYANQVAAFETRLLRMKTAYTEATISIPQIRITQEAAKIEIQNIMDSMLFDMPRLKSAIIRVAALINVRKARAEDDARREAARKIAELGADLLDQAYTEAKASQGKALDDVAALASLADKLMATVNKGQQLDEENREKRKQAAEKLVEVKASVTSALEQVDIGA
jgi:uncharacterized protein YaaN involved in tellurite resistance